MQNTTYYSKLFPYGLSKTTLKVVTGLFAHFFEVHGYTKDEIKLLINTGLDDLIQGFQAFCNGRTTVFDIGKIVTTTFTKITGTEPSIIQQLNIKNNLLLYLNAICINGQISRTDIEDVIDQIAEFPCCSDVEYKVAKRNGEAFIEEAHKAQELPHWFKICGKSVISRIPSFYEDAKKVRAYELVHNMTPTMWAFRNWHFRLMVMAAAGTIVNNTAKEFSEMSKI